MELNEARLVLKEDGDLYWYTIFHQRVTLPEISTEARVVVIDVNENVIVYSNNDFIEKIETDEGVIRTRYFLKRSRIQSKIRGKQLRKKLLERYKRRERQRIRELINKAKEVGATVLVMEDL